MRLLKYTFLLIAAFFVAACGSDNVVYQKYKSFDSSVWPKDTMAVFSFDSEDTSAVYDVLVDIRNTDDYPYENFWLFANFVSPKGDIFSDTLNCKLADDNGRPVGSGIGSVHNSSFVFLQNISFPRNGRYRFQLIHGMRVDSLVGISDIGIRIVKNDVTSDEK